MNRFFRMFRNPFKNRTKNIPIEIQRKVVEEAIAAIDRDDPEGYEAVVKRAKLLANEYSDRSHPHQTH